MTYADTRALAVKAGRTRIVVGGVDVTNFRGKTTPTPIYSLTEPFAYGAMSLEFAQVHGGYEAGNFGSGDLAWVREGARVVLSRTFDANPEVVDYVGRVISIDPSGGSLSLSVGGEFSGPAGLLEEQTYMYRQSLDVGRYASLAAARAGVSFSPWFGPVTGIKVTHAGGQTLLSWAQYLGAMSQDTAGVQRALMPLTWGGSTWAFGQKDYTTKHLTAFNDDARVVLSVTRDAAEAPNVIYGTGITPDGERITNAKWPGVFAGPAPDYPMAGNADFGLGTADADTVNGDGITVLYVKLRDEGYLPFDVQNTGVYTSDIVAAVRKLQIDVRLTVTGTMTLDGWNRLFNAAFTGYTINGAFIAPLASDPRVEEFVRTSNGNIAGRNPAYDSTVLRVERTIDFGAGITKAAMIAFAQGVLARSTTLKNWVGTLRLNGAGAFTGSHDTGAGLTAADVMPYRDIRPGMNVWVPYFDGGTLFHIAGVDVDADGATLTIDTQARDLVEVEAINSRNTESRRDIRREWVLSNRPNKPSSAMIARDESFGITDRAHKLIGGQWNRIAVIAGQHGQVNRVRTELVSDKPQYAVAASAKHYGEKWWAHNVGDPLVVSAESVWEKASLADEFQRRDILYAAGDGKQPCGYFPRRHRDDNNNVTDAPITGLHVDDANWTYISAVGTAVIVYIWIWPDRDCTLKKGRILYPQLDDAA